MVNSFIDKLYAGFLGMNVGIRLGAPVEGGIWTYDLIREVFGEADGHYLKENKNFAADDDVNGPVYFLRALTDNGITGDFSAEMVGKAWLNYARNGKGMFWWGGVGRSTEHTAYANLKNGIMAPKSGSIEQNGAAVAEQIGGQIFIDTWGLIWPGNPQKAAEYAVKAASVSHDGNGIYGAAFIAACIAQAYVSNDIKDIIEIGLKQIPDDCTYSAVVRAVREFYNAHPKNWRDCMDYLLAEWGYDRYPGVCHIIPNAGVCALALYYGEGDFNRTVEIATMCGWDTDCNAGNVGTILGVMCGLSGISRQYREPIRDTIIVSGIAGSLNMIDVPTYVKELAHIAYVLRGEPMPEDIVRPKDGEVLLDFELPGATHGVRLSDRYANFVVRQTKGKAHTGNGSLEIVFEHLMPYQPSKIFWKPFYRRKDFDDERYSPVFSPVAYTGQHVELFANLELITEGSICLTPYVHLSLRDKDVLLDPIDIAENQWTRIAFEIPETNGDFVDEIGVKLSSYIDGRRVYGRLFLDDFSIKGGAEYRVDMTIQQAEFGQITPFSYNQCECSVDGEWLVANSEECAQVFTGNYYAKDVTMEAFVRPLSGETIGLILRGQGAIRYYSFGFDGKRRVSIARQDYERTVLAAADFVWENSGTYKMKASACGNKLQLWIDEKLVLQTQDDALTYGMVGYCTGQAGSFAAKGMHVIADRT